MPNKVLTHCCALCQMSATNEESYEDLKKFIDELKAQAGEKDYYGEFNEFGQKSVFCLTTPSEKMLEHNLTKLGFRVINRFQRRKGYPATGNLKMWILNFWL